MVLTSSRNSANSSCKMPKRFFDASSDSFFNAASSISSCIKRRVTWSSSVGIEFISTRIVALASSIKSMALSGKKRSVIYRSDKVAAATSALSWMLTPWWISNRSFKPRKIEIVSWTVGSCTSTFWKRRSKALSFSMYCRYSSRVVAPIVCNSPLANIGFSKFPASMLPSVLPAPTILWISSIKRMIRPSAFFTSCKTAFKRSSNSPRNLAPAIKAPISREKIVLSFRFSGTSFRTIRCANPSTMAVLPTPGSPIKTGLFLVFRERMRITSRISSSRPIMGSIFPLRTCWTKSTPYFSNALYCSSWFCEVTRSPPLNVSIVCLISFAVIPCFFKYTVKGWFFNFINA